MKMFTPVLGLSVYSIAENPESPCTGVHIFTLPLNVVQFGLYITLVRFRFVGLSKPVERTVYNHRT